jgi:serine/threonine-protein kinase HipA
VDNALDWDLLRETAPFFRIEAERAEKIILEVKSAVQSWEKEAKAIGIPKLERDLKANAFRMAF